MYGGNPVAKKWRLFRRIPFAEIEPISAYHRLDRLGTEDSDDAEVEVEVGRASMRCTVLDSQ